MENKFMSDSGASKHIKIEYTEAEPGVFGHIKMEYTEAENRKVIENNDDLIFKYIIRNCFPGVKAMINKYFRGLDAKEVCEDALVAAIENMIKKKNIVISNFCGYLYRICWHICIDEGKRKRIKIPDDIPDDIPDIEELIEQIKLMEQIEKNEQIERMTALKNKMGLPCQEIIDLRFGIKKGEVIGITVIEDDKNRDFKEIANMLKIETATARQRFHRCLKELRKMFFNKHVQLIVM